ncbi:MAG: hypothetical protein ISS18_04625 [Bacteroidales bacterium]|nr:hypothetical protein [Bacteroidales bacterium]
MQKSKKRNEQKQRSIFRDLWQLIIKVIIILVLIAWFIKEFLQNRELDPISLIILIILIAFIIWLIWRQKHIVNLHCNLASPGGCVKGDPNILSGKILEPVVGDAYGLGFSHYLIELRDPGANLLSDVVIYPDGGGNPDTSLTQGNSAITGGTLGWIDVEKAVQDAGILLLTSTTFEITLRVFDVYGGEKGTPCKTNFDVSINEVYIKRVSTPWSVDFVDPNEPLKRSDDPASELATIGGYMHMRGAANVYGCAGENIDEYTIWAIPDPNFTFAQPAPFTAVTPQPDWVEVTHIEFKSQTINGTVYSADDVRAYNVLDGNPNPDILTNTWGTRNECMCIHIDATISCFCWKIPDLKSSAFNSNTALLPYKLDPGHIGGTGKFTFLLQVIDTSGNQYYDIQKAWIDNEKEVAKITGISGIAACQDLYTQDSNGNFKTVDIEGTAWDALIDPTGPDLTKPTSDNFDKYEVKFQKQGIPTEVELITSNSPVPARPAPVGVGVLTTWNLESLNKATNPMGFPVNQLLEDGESCTYNIILRVWDLTIVNENAPGVHYSGKITFPIKIINSPEPTP